VAAGSLQSQITTANLKNYPTLVKTMTEKYSILIFEIIGLKFNKT
jgi:hypothetical protein